MRAKPIVKRQVIGKMGLGVLFPGDLICPPPPTEARTEPYTAVSMAAMGKRLIAIDILRLLGEFLGDVGAVPTLPRPNFVYCIDALGVCMVCWCRTWLDTAAEE